MGPVRKFSTICGCGAALLLLGAAQRPQALAQSSPGLWEISGLPGGAPLRQCVADPAALARVEHRGESCTQVVVSDGPAQAVIHYTCVKNGFGQTKITALTPRSLRIETQGISGGAPFNYLIQARRVANCEAH